jgi:hypothetical protein
VLPHRLSSLVEVCDLVEVARARFHTATASGRGQKHIAVGFCLGGSREGFALLGQCYPILTIVHPCRLMASGQVPSGPICDRVSSRIAKCGESHVYIPQFRAAREDYFSSFTG